MKEEEKILNQFQDSISGVSSSLMNFSKELEKISKQSEKELSEKELEMVNDFKEKLKTLKGVDFSSIMELKAAFDQKVKNGL